MKTKLVRITPAMAKMYLQKNKINRKISLRRVDEYARDIETGNWKLTHQGIAFYTNGNIADGQHRLMAIVKTNKPVSCLVTTGLPLSVSIGIDVMRTRSASDVIAIKGDSPWIRNRHVSMIKLIASPIRLTPSTTEDWLHKMKESAIFSVTNLCTNKKRIVIAATHAAVAMAHYHKVDSEKLARFCEVLMSGMMENNNEQIIIRLRDDLLSSEANGEVASKEKMRKTQRAIQIYVNGEKVKKLHTPDELIWSFSGDEE